MPSMGSLVSSSSPALWALAAVLVALAVLAYGRGAVAPLHAGKRRPGMSRKAAWMAVAGLTAAWLVAALPRLGDGEIPLSAWAATRAREGVILDLGRPLRLGNLYVFDAEGDGTYRIAVSAAGAPAGPGAVAWPGAIAWDDRADLVTKDYFAWHVLPLAGPADKDAVARYVLLEAKTAGGAIGELAVTAAGSDAQLPFEIIPVGGAFQTRRLQDEPSTFRASPTYLSETYFDEIYYVRTAHELRDGVTPYETTHPPLGKLLVEASILIFGDHPFGWRLLGVLAGALMIPALYLAAARLSGSRLLGVAAATLVALDGMHFAQSRMATGDAYLGPALAAAYAFAAAAGIADRRSLRPTWALVGAAACFGVLAAIKWVGVFACAGFLGLLLGRACRDCRIRRGGYRRLSLRRSARWAATMAIAVIVPALVYLASYLPLQSNRYFAGRGVRGVLEEQRHMYGYHHELAANHPYGTAWWEWPLLGQPLFLSSGKNLPAGRAVHVVDLGNPVIWWGGALALLAFVTRGILRGERFAAVVATCFFAQYLPWLAISRVTFVYHYYTALVFVLIALAAWIERGWTGSGAARWLASGYMAACCAAFVLFYPILAGIPVSRGLVDFLRWLPSWNF